MPHDSCVPSGQPVPSLPLCVTQSLPIHTAQAYPGRKTELAKWKRTNSVGKETWSSTPWTSREGDLPFLRQMTTSESTQKSFPKANHRMVPAGCEMICILFLGPRSKLTAECVLQFLFQMKAINGTAAATAAHGPSRCRTDRDDPSTARAPGPAPKADNTSLMLPKDADHSTFPHHFL